MKKQTNNKSRPAFSNNNENQRKELENINYKIKKYKI